MRDSWLGLRPRHLSCDRNLELIIYLLNNTIPIGLLIGCIFCNTHLSQNNSLAQNNSLNTPPLTSSFNNNSNKMELFVHLASYTAVPGATKDNVKLLSFN